MNHSDPWDNLLHAMGQGWPHYKSAALPLIDTHTNTTNSLKNKQNPKNTGRYPHRPTTYAATLVPHNIYHCKIIFLWYILRHTISRTQGITAPISHTFQHRPATLLNFSGS